MSGRFEGKVAVVTGAADGIGAASARRLHAEGARVALVASAPSRCAGWPPRSVDRRWPSPLTSAPRPM